MLGIQKQLARLQVESFRNRRETLCYSSTASRSSSYPLLRLADGLDPRAFR